MPDPALIEIMLTLDEAKAVARLLAAGIAEIEADTSPVSNEVTLRRSLKAAGRGAEKIMAAMAAAGVSS